MLYHQVRASLAISSSNYVTFDQSTFLNAIAGPIGVNNNEIEIVHIKILEGGDERRNLADQVQTCEEKNVEYMRKCARMSATREVGNMGKRLVEHLTVGMLVYDTPCMLGDVGFLSILFHILIHRCNIRFFIAGARR
jgi:hypothetical protein